MNGFPGLPCICCSATDSVAVELSDLTTFHCSQCDESFTSYDAQNVIDKWKPVLAWLATAHEPSEQHT